MNEVWRKARRPRFEPVEAPIFKWLTWAQSHCEPVSCAECGHPERSHHCWTGTGTEVYACERCTCRTGCEAFQQERHAWTVQRRGQFLSAGPYPHSVWVIPLEPAPWESGRAAAVTLFVIEPGRYTTDYQEFRHERREVNRRARDRKRLAAAA